MQWFRWYNGTTSDPKIGSIARKTGVMRERVIAVWAMLLESANEGDDRGRYSVDADGIADCLHCDTESVECILKEMAKRGMIEDGTIAAFEKRNPPRDNSLQRVRKHRAKKNVTPVTRYSNTRNGDVTALDTDTEEETTRGTDVPLLDVTDGRRSFVPGGKWMWDAWLADFGQDHPGITQYTNTRREKLKALFIEQMADADDPPAELHRIFAALRRHPFWGDKPNTWKPETCMRSAERREEIAALARRNGNGTRAAVHIPGEAHDYPIRDPRLGPVRFADEDNPLL